MRLPDGNCRWVRLTCPEDYVGDEASQVIESDEEKVESQGAPAPEMSQGKVLAFESCSDLPSLEALKAWPIHAVYDRPCPFGPDDLKYPWWENIKDLGDGTIIGRHEQSGCIRLRVERCFKK